ncbi:MAG: hypothetical protein FJ247_10680 [Nitrospira sp.]|nr:hypothetical protein [Nitrospira sp.]
MTPGHDRRQLLFLTLTIYWSSILFGLTAPWISNIAVDVLKHGQPLVQAIHQLRLHLFAPGYNLFLIAALNAAPFVLFAVVALLHLGLIPPEECRLARRRSLALCVALLLGIGLSAWTHVMTLWFPDAQGALAYFFLPFVLLALFPLGYLAGRGLGAWLFR